MSVMVQRWVEKKDYEPQEVAAAAAAAGWHFVSVYLQNSFLTLGPLLLDLRIPGSLELGFRSTNSDQIWGPKKKQKTQLNLKSTSHKQIADTHFAFVCQFADTTGCYSNLISI